jgi:hypothetical protein
MSAEVIDRRALAKTAFENAGREISQAFEVMNANTSLAAGALAAILAVLGAGELFGRGASKAGQDGTFPRLSAVSLVVLAATAPLIVRFFVRSMTSYQSLLRFNAIQRAAWSYLTNRVSWQAFDFHVDLYWNQWKSPKPMRTLVLHNLKYGFMWISAVTGLALAWAFWSVDEAGARLFAGGLLLLGLGWEGITLLDYRKRYFQTPDCVERKRLQELMASPPLGPRERVERLDDWDLLEQSSGMFIGRRRLFRKPL